MPDGANLGEIRISRHESHTAQAEKLRNVK
jgi:hypothetical protein